VNWKGWQTRVLFAIIGIWLAGLAPEVFFHLHYAAPITAALYVLLMFSFRQLRTWRWRSNSVGLFLARTIPVLCLAMLALRIIAKPLHLIEHEPEWPAAWYNAPLVKTGRAIVEQQLDATIGNHLVLVGLSKTPTLYDWVHNSADIDGQKVVWARDMGAAENAKLLRYYGGRHVWFLTPNDAHPQLIPCSSDPD
jgi:hypothetical protein